MMKLKQVLIRLFLILGAGLMLLPAALPAQAADYSNADMIDDGTFNDVGTMGATIAKVGGWPSATQPASNYAAVTNFLNGSDHKLTGASPCLASYSTQNWFYDGTTFHYGTDSNWNVAWGPAQVSAAQVIYTTAYMWGINPQVLLATLQKEQSLISGSACDAGRYQAAMGYGCPDSGGCNAKYAGFTKQVFWAGFQFVFNQQRSEGNISWYGNDDITYVGYFSNGVSQSLPYKRCAGCATLPNAYTTPATIDGQSITIANGATASLYTYTPHLNQSFPGIFEGWFGSVRYHGSDPVGNLDVVEGAPSAVRLAGWGLDRSLSGPALIHVYIDGGFVGTITANASRTDVGAAFPGQGNNHGFDGQVPWTTAGTHQVCAWVVGDNIGAGNYGIGCKSVTINNDTVGSLDMVQQAPSAIRLAGWGLDRSLVGPAAIHVYVGGTFAGSITANANRADVGAIFANVGNTHGYDNTVPWTTAGTQQVCAWVVGDSLGAQIYGLGCRTLVIANNPTGSLDLVQGGTGTIRAAGWGLDPSFNGSSPIHVYIDGVFNQVATAGIARGDVGPHGFDATAAGIAPGAHQLCAWVIGDGVGAPNYGLGCKSATVR